MPSAKAFVRVVAVGDIHYGRASAGQLAPILTAVADLTDRFAAGIRLLTNAVGSGGDPSPARRQLAAVAAETDPRTIGAGSWHVQALVLLLRSPLVDAMEAAGATPEEARAALPEL